MSAVLPHRRKLFGIAYRMLGSASDAEDVLQDAWLRFRDARGIDDDEAWLVTTTTRLCLDRLKSARARRETYVGPWLPEPLETSTEEIDPDSVSVAFLTLLERLSPEERAVFLLKQVFDLEHGEIAASLGITDASSRQLFHRAKGHLADARPRPSPDREAHARLLGAFVFACQAGDVDGLRRLLADDVRAHTDSGGKVRAARRVLHGADAVARFFVGITRKGAGEGISLELRELNGRPAFVLFRDGKIASTFGVDTDGERIVAVHVVSNPDKLARLRGPSS